MQHVRNPFVVTLHYAFQDASRVYFVLEHVGGGDLFSALETHTRFPEAWCLVYAAEVTLALALTLALSLALALTPTLTLTCLQAQDVPL